MRRRLAQLHAEDRGSVSVFFVVAVTAVTAILGLVVDGGRQLQARQHASAVAEEAARAASQVVDADKAVRGQQTVVSAGEATRTARTYLAAAGVRGTARVTSGGKIITVTTTVTYRPAFLGVFGVGPTTVTDSASARLTVGIQEEQS